MYNSNQEEQEILKYWDEHQTFEKSVASRSEEKPYHFYDGPPFATGLPHYGHILSSVIKDVVPRYWTMKGFKVRRRWGWDCHGLPIESLIEKELKISGKKQIEEIGVGTFNEACRSKVLQYTHEWKKMVNRIGRWVEFDNAYKTMDSTYMESVWWALKNVWDKGMIYEGRKVLMYCPRCETPVSKAEIAMDNSYKDITEESATAKFKVKNPEKYGLPENTYILAWTTTPWTLPGNVALAVGNDIEYSILETSTNMDRGIEGGEMHIQSGHYIVATDRVQHLIKEGNYFTDNIKKVSGKDLVGIEYEPLFDMPAVKETGKKAYYVAAGDFVTTVDGTGIVHTAVIYGEEDYNLGVKLDLPMVPMLDEKGHFNEVAPEFIRGQYFKKAEKEIKNDLEKRGLLFSREQYTHSYPHCWRCDTQLFYNAISAWFIDIQKIKGRLIELNEKINWYPEHLKHGRFLNILETAPDWNISRNRYWATPLPFWKCDNKDCAETLCVGSVAELREKALNFAEVFTSEKVEEMDLHKQFTDKIKIKCQKCNGVMSRIPEVIDCWLESGSMPFAEFHYPFENKVTFTKNFPGQYIAEYIAQTRAWFYYMHVVSTLLFDTNSFENCVTTGTILNEKGEKLSKSKMNYTDPWVIIEQYGVDALRYYLMTSVVMEAENLFFNEREVRDIYNKVINILWNVATFYLMYAPEYDGKTKAKDSTHILDKWILAKLQVLVKEVTVQMDNYNTVRAGRPIKDFIDELSTWYLRRSRDRFKGENEQDKQFALATLNEVLSTLAKVMAPFTPFIAEKIYQTTVHSSQFIEAKESVHLEDWPEVNKDLENEEVLEKMSIVAEVVELGHSLRKENQINVRQPLPLLVINLDVKLAQNIKLSDAYLEIVKDELNIKNVKIWSSLDDSSSFFKGSSGKKVAIELDIRISEELKKEGLVREIVRTINQIRKDQKFTISDKVIIKYYTEDALLRAVFVEYAEELKKSVLAESLVESEGGEEKEIGEAKVKVLVEKA